MHETVTETAPPGARLALKMVDLRHQIDRLELEFAQVAAEFARTDFWDYDGSNSALDWIRFNCKMTSNAAADRISVGRRLAELGQSAQAMEAGEIGFAHLSVMARTADAVGKAFDETKLLDLARDNSPGKFHYKCLHYRHSVDANGYAREQADLHAERSLRLNTAEDGCLVLIGVLDPVGGAAVRTALEPLAKASGKHDHRLREQRMADALVELATKGGKQTVQMQVTSSIETLLGLVGAPGAENEFSLPISSKTVERWACDCSLTRVLLKDSVGSPATTRRGPHQDGAERTIKGPRRRALIARDQHCRWPGCERPASWCDGHHLNHWLHGGGGEIENQVLLCGRHHRLVHEGGWQLVKTDDGRIVPIAPTVRFGPPRAPN